MRLEVATADAPRPAARYSQGIRVDSLVITAGQGGFDPVTGQLHDGITAQAHQAFKNVDAILKAGGTSLRNAVRINVYLASLADFAAMNVAYEQYISDPAPARTTVEAGLAPGMLIEVDAIAALPA